MLRDLPQSNDPRVLVGFGTSDDAGVYRLSDELALVQTVDFFTPIVDDPYDFGRIAAANALSDIYAMGGIPITALNIAAFPIETLGAATLASILRGGGDVAREAGVALLGGHTVKDDEPKYGMAVTGTIHPDRIVGNARARIGDALVLTKPLGTGILGSALKNDAIDAAQMAACVRWMTTLNAGASRAMLAAGARSATDVTGYGLLGHGYEMARGSGVRFRIGASLVPVYALAREMVARGITPGGTRANAREHAEFTTYAASVPADLRAIFSDAQTSGGLLIAIGPDGLGALLEGLRAAGVRADVIGSVEAGAGIVVEA
ncbi:MAG: selenide, water dikinase SelD [Vulcanimicrobiaceae bacterium]